MEEKLVSYNTAVLAKSKGFNELVWAEYDCHRVENWLYGYQDGYSLDLSIILRDCENNYPDIPAPTQGLLQKWLRDTYDIHIEITHWDDNKWSAIVVHDKYSIDEEGYEAFGEETYEDALEIGLYEALKLLDDKN